jgi:glycosyltransferase involved in cell wall biosynthesis
MVRHLPNFRFFTSEFLYDDTVSPPPGTTYAFFRVSNFISKSLHLPHRYKRVLRGLEYPLNLIYIIFYILANKINVIHMNFSLTPKIDRLFIRILTWLNRTVFLTVHNAVPHDSTSTSFKKYRELYEAPGVIFTLTEYVKTQILSELKVKNTPITVIPHGNMDFVLNQAQDSSGMQYDKPSIVFSGAIRPYKDLFFLLEAFISVLKSAEANLLIIGRARETMDKYHAYARENGIYDNIIWKTDYSPLNEMYTITKNADVFAFPYNKASQSGGIPTSFSLGKPVVIRPVGGLPEMIVEGKDGLVADTPEEMSRKIVELIINRQSYDRMTTFINSKRRELNSWVTICDRMCVSYFEK